MGKSAQGILRAVLLGIALFGFSLVTSAELSFALESSLLGSDILGASTLDASVVSRLEGKSAAERAEIKSEAIVGQRITGRYTSGGITMEVEKVEKIAGGVQVFARAWKNDEPIGFGADGSVEIERFRIFNPPILVDDPNGTIVREWTDVAGESGERRLREDPEEALRQTLSHVVSVVGKEGAHIVRGKVGNTTSTFFPDGNPESTTVDGNVRREGVDETLATIRAGAGTSASDTETQQTVPYIATSGTTNQFQRLIRAFYLFDTSEIPDSDVINSATFSVYGYSKAASNSPEPDYHVASSSPASDTALLTSDYVAVGTTSFGSITYSSYSTSGYNDVSLNATGIANISKTGLSKFSTQLSWDINNNFTGTWSSIANYSFGGYYADQSGTSNDPKLVVVHFSSAANAPTSLLTNGQTNPVNLTGTTPEFSAVYNDPNTDDVAASYRIQVATSSDFTSVYWDSGKTTLASSTPQGTRIADVIYGGTALATSTTYYWRIKFWDASDAEGSWSTESATFSITGGVTKVRKSVNESVANSTLLQSDDELRLALSANTTYIIDGIVFASSTSGTPDLTIGFSSPSGAILTVGYTNAADQEVLTANATSSRIALVANTPRSIHFKGTIKTSGNGGDLILQWAQATANAVTTTVMQGSFLRVDAI